MRITLPKELSPDGTQSNLEKTLLEKVAGGIAKKATKTTLKMLQVIPLSAELKLGADLKLGTEFREIKFREIKFREIEWMNFDRPFKKIKQRPFDAELRMGTEFRQIKFREIGWLNLNVELDFNR
jgi:hypothetical protein